MNSLEEYWINNTSLSIYLSIYLSQDLDDDEDEDEDEEMVSSRLHEDGVMSPEDSDLAQLRSVIYSLSIYLSN